MSTTDTAPLPPLVLLDGGLGTTLSLAPYNITFTPSTPLWSSHLLLSPSSLATLSSIQRSFVSAGAEILLTDTYQASFSGFARTPGWEGGKKEAAKCMRAAVSVARDAFVQEGKKNGIVALSFGPYGASMSPGQEYSGKYDEEHQTVKQLEKWHRERLDAFLPVRAAGNDSVSEEEIKEKEECWKNVDLIAFETVPLLKEVEAVIKVMESVPADLRKPFWICCVFPGEEFALPDGSSIEKLVKALLGGKKQILPMGIGLNCTKIGKVEGLIEQFEKAVQSLNQEGQEIEQPSLVLYPDGTDGEVYNTTTMKWEQKGHGSELPWDTTLFDVVSRARGRRSWKSIIFGGCCKTSPEHIEKLRMKIDA